MWIGEEPLVGAEYDPSSPDFNPKKNEMRNIKRAVCASICEQLFQCYANAKECYCSHGSESPQCKCFLVTSNRVPVRVSDIELAAWRLNFSNTAPNTKLLRLRTVHLYWMNSQDVVIQRCATLLKRNTKSWSAQADAALEKIGTMLSLGRFSNWFSELVNFLVKVFVVTTRKMKILEKFLDEFSMICQ